MVGCKSYTEWSSWTWIGLGVLWFVEEHGGSEGFEGPFLVCVAGGAFPDLKLRKMDPVRWKDKVRNEERRRTAVPLSRFPFVKSIHMFVPAQTIV